MASISDLDLPTHVAEQLAAQQQAVPNRMVEISEITSLEILNRRLAEGKEWVLVNMVQHPDPGAKETKMVYIMARFEPLQP